MTAAPTLVTVIIPTYNWSAVLPYSIGSVLRQTYPHFELLVIGDGCTDDSEAVVRAVGDSRVRWIGLPVITGHQSQVNNEGLRQARGEVIAYLGHDDLWLPHHLACLVAAVDAGADLAYGLAALVGPEGSYTESVPVFSEYRPRMTLPPSCVAHRRGLIDRVGGWRPYRELKVNPESDLWSRIHDAGYRLVFVPRLTAIKFPASLRRDVYKTRPHHEQALWSQRIQTETDFEAMELAGMLTGGRKLAGLPYPDLIRVFLRECLHRVRRRLEQFRRKPWPGKGKVIDRTRGFKGLQSPPGSTTDGLRRSV